MFRVGYALRKQTGYIRLQMPRYQWRDRPLETWLKKNISSVPEAYSHWRRQNSPAFLFREARFPNDIPWNPKQALSEAERVLGGELKYFDHKFIKTGFPPDWHKDPVSGIKLDSRKHWSEISDENSVDIKFIWEASRFSMVYTLVRAYAFTQDEKFAEAFWRLVQSWAESNPPNAGPNWMDGQEAALRLMAWTFGFFAFLDSPSSTPDRIAQFTLLAAAHAERIDKNIDYAISTQSNHTISEAFGLWMVGILFPELKEAEKYSALGLKLLEQEATAQIFPDGSYSMYSLNYHRFILHIYLYAIRLGELNNVPFSYSLRQRVSKSIEYLYQLIDPETGQMPVYGSNDGALALPLNNCDFADYRPLLQLGSYATKKKRLFPSGAWDEPLYWLYGSQALQSEVLAPPQTSQTYPDGGVSILRGSQSKAIIRCTDYRARPSHADQLHLDLWIHGRNIACDAGTYLYSGEGVWRNGLAHTAVHNTVTVDHLDQMKMLTRFTWTDWSCGKVLKRDKNIWEGQHDGYKPVIHRRTVMALEGDRWLVVDHLQDVQPHHYALHWLLNDVPYEQKENLVVLSVDSLKYKVQAGVVEGKSVFSVIRGDPNDARGWRSRYYGHKEPAISILLETDQPQVCFWTFFGVDSDEVKLTGNHLETGFDGAQTSINLQLQIANFQTDTLVFAASSCARNFSVARKYFK